MGVIFNDAAAVIANGASLSGAVALGAGAPVAIATPAAWTAANLTFQGSVDGTTFLNLYDDAGTEVTVTAAVDRYIALSASLFAGCRFLKIRSGTAGTPVNQGAARTLTVVTRRSAGE
jgi:hypothetical protein